MMMKKTNKKRKNIKGTHKLINKNNNSKCRKNTWKGIRISR